MNIYINIDSIEKGLAGIYKITSPSGKIYIGQAIDIQRRLKEHARCAKYKNTVISKAIDKYGFENFKIQLLITFKPKKDNKFNRDLLDAFEIGSIKKYNALNKTVGYNIAEGGSGGRTVLDNSQNKRFKGKTHTEETKLKIKNHPNSIKNKERKTGVKLEGETLQKLLNSLKRKWRAVTQYDLFGKYIATFDNLKIASDKTGVKSCSISRNCRGAAPTAGGYLWKYAEDKLILGDKLYTKYFAVEQYDLNMNLITTYKSIKKASIATTVCHGYIKKCIVGEMHSYKGFIFREALRNNQLAIQTASNGIAQE